MWLQLSSGSVYRAGKLGVLITSSFPNKLQLTLLSRIGGLEETWEHREYAGLWGEMGKELGMVVVVVVVGYLLNPSIARHMFSFLTLYFLHV